MAILRRMIEIRFGAIPKWAEGRLARRSAPELEELAGRLLSSQSLKELLK